MSHILDFEDINELEEIKEQIADLIGKARAILRGTSEYARADAYWLAHIEFALGDREGQAVTMAQTIAALREEADAEDEDEGDAEDATAECAGICPADGTTGPWA